MSSCPQHVIHMGGVPVYCLVDTGSMVATITKRCFAACFKPWGTYLMKKGQWPFYNLLGVIWSWISNCVDGCFRGREYCCWRIPLMVWPTVFLELCGWIFWATAIGSPLDGMGVLFLSYLLCCRPILSLCRIYNTVTRLMLIQLPKWWVEL